VAKKTRVPADANQRGKAIVDLAVAERTVKVRNPGKDPAAVELGRRGGQKGGRARAEKLTAEERSASARKAAQARWTKRDEVRKGDN
jgi:hypothetical protein